MCEESVLTRTLLHESDEQDLVAADKALVGEDAPGGGGGKAASFSSAEELLQALPDSSTGGGRFPSVLQTQKSHG